MFHFMVDIHIYFGGFGFFNGGRKSPTFQPAVSLQGSSGFRIRAAG